MKDKGEKRKREPMVALVFSMYYMQYISISLENNIFSAHPLTIIFVTA